jgi:hypothetical protein
MGNPMSAEMKIRQFHPRDIDGVFTLVQKTIEKSYPPYYTPEDILGYYKMAKSFPPSGIPRWDFNGKRFTFSGAIGSGNSGNKTVVFEIIQKGNLIYGGYQGEKSEFGEIVGVMNGDTIELSYLQEHLDGTTYHSTIIATISQNPEGKIRFLDARDMQRIRGMEEV